ncbi:MAG: fimbria/pilus periplasmic chaperone [Luteibacter jiangsuensis]
MKRTNRLLAAIALTIGTAGAAHAGVVIMGTRAVYPSDAKDITIRLTNKYDRPALVQNWIDKGEANESPDNLKVPFTITPPVARIEAGKDQALRVIFTGDRSKLPSDRESVFWFNMLDVPPKTKTEGNFLKLAFRTRIKLFYRPNGLPGSQLDAEKGIRWSLVPKGNGYLLHGVNDSPYFVSFNHLDVKAGGSTFPVELGATGMVPPKASADFTVSKATGSLTGAIVSGAAVTDFGAFTDIEQPIAR